MNVTDNISKNSGHETSSLNKGLNVFELTSTGVGMILGASELMENEEENAR